MRNVTIFLILVIIFLAVFRLSRLAQSWHYVVPAAPGELLYATAFDGPSDEWEQVTGQKSSAQIIDGAMQLAVDSDGELIFSAAGPHFGDFDFQVDARAVDGPVDNSYGTIFRQRDGRNYYVFFISSDGFYQVKRVINGTTKTLSGWNASELIHQGMDAVNTVRVVGYQDRFRFYINDEPVQLCIPDDPTAESTPLPTGECRGGTWQDTLTDDSIHSGRLGVTVEVGVRRPTGVAVSFDNVLIYGPQPIGG